MYPVQLTDSDILNYTCVSHVHNLNFEKTILQCSLGVTYGEVPGTVVATRQLMDLLHKFIAAQQCRHAMIQIDCV